MRTTEFLSGDKDIAGEELRMCLVQCSGELNVLGSGVWPAGPHRSGRVNLHTSHYRLNRVPSAPDV